MIDHHVVDQQPLHPADAAAAIIVVGDEGYLLQLRDQRPGIFFPAHWGLFGGAVDPGEQSADTLRRELQEELDLVDVEVQPFATFHFDLRPVGLDCLYREFFEVHIPTATLASLRLGEGSEARVCTREEVMTMPRLVPYDAFALWMHVNQTRLSA